MELKQLKTNRYTPSHAEFWRVTIALMAASILIFSALYAFQPLLPVFVKVFNISVTVSSLLVSSSVVTMIIGLFVLGFLADRYGRVAIMRVSLVMTVVPLIAIPLTDSFEWIIALRLIQGFFIAGIPAAAMGYLAEEVDPKHLGLAMTLYISSNALGGMGGRVFSGYLTDLLSWQTTFFALAGFGVFATLLFIFLLPKERFFRKVGQSIRTDIRGMFVHFKNPTLISLFMMGLLLQIVFTAIWTYLPFYLHEEEPFDWPLRWISFTYFAYALGVIAPPLAGKLSNQLGLPAMMLSGLSILAIGTWLTAVPSIPYMLIGLGLICTGFFIAHSMAAALVSKTATHHRSGASSFYLINYYVGVAIGSTAVGRLWDHYSWIGVISTSFLLILVVFFLPIFKKLEN
ncbi:MFS transporter [Alkalihalobacillus sp. AL-G]|uniref:MFS transporter n=1 Tax=Alkalihalobacillus sp. AL-G TaxID=2926399 RepID=UPI002729D8FB|nr:MFS transporter [Alkalihalobacillus sp. AL-G]WLD92663.1 MFS transporter [Alkalihalobacillus sp. AL-G]